MVSALAGARQMVLRYHQKYLIVQVLQVVSPHVRVDNLQSSEGCYFRASLCSPASSYNVGGPEVGLRDPGGGTEPSAAIPSSWTGTGDASLSDSGPYGALEMLLGHSGRRSPSTSRIPGGALDTCSSGVPLSRLRL